MLGRWFPGVGRREVLVSITSIGFAAGIAGGALIGGRAMPASGLVPATVSTSPAVTSTTHPPTTARPSSGPPPTTAAPAGPQPAAGGSAAAPAMLGPAAGGHAPPTTHPAVTVGETTTTRRCNPHVGSNPHQTDDHCQRR